MPAKHYILEIMVQQHPTRLFDGFLATVGSKIKTLMTQDEMETVEPRNAKGEGGMWKSFIETVTEYILSIPVEYQPNRGDVIITHVKHNPHQGVMFWTGSEAVDRDYQMIEIGHIPTCFRTLEEFEPKHWSKIITETDAIPVRTSYISRMEVISDSESYCLCNEKHYIRFLFRLGMWVGCCYTICENKSEWVAKAMCVLETGKFTCFHSICQILQIEEHFNTVPPECDIYMVIG